MNRLILKSALGLAILTGCALPANAQEALYPNTFPLSEVKLLDGQFKHAMDLNVDVLLQYDVDRLLAPYLKEAGLPAKGESFSCWDGLDGHVGGHYLSALAIHYAATGNPQLKERMDYMISELDRCQKANGDGYVGGVPNGKALWSEIKKGNVGLIWKYWVPWYNVHKIYAGLRDAWMYTGNEKARDMFLKMCDWGIEVIAPLDDKQMEAMLDNEFGGMDEVYADAYAITGDKKYLEAAKRFSHHWLLDSMAEGVDNLDNKHANTQVPKVVGYQRIAELSGASIYDKAAEFFWHTVADTRSLSIGGNSRREHFAPADDCISYATDREGPESCNTNNMLKLSEGLFRMTGDRRYSDFYELALFNHILSTQHPGHGGYVYFTSARPGHYRVYSQPNSAMWCCVGTGMENHGKYGQFIYTHDGDDRLQVNLFIPSQLQWKEKGVTITQNTDFPDSESSRITVNTGKRKNVKFSLSVRRPGWCDGMKVSVNGQEIKAAPDRNGYIDIDRKWNDGDVVELSLPMEVRVVEMPNVPEYVSIMRGPIVLGAKYSEDDLVGLVGDDSRWAHIAGGPLVSVYDTPLLIGTRQEIESRLKNMKPVEGKPMAFTVPGLFEGKYKDLVLEPFYRLHDCRYMMYWLTMTPEQFKQHSEEEAAKEAAKLALDRRTVDAVNTGEQQPEADHFMEFDRSEKGNFQGEAWRHASDGGYFTYKMKTGSNPDLTLLVRYWGNENGNRKFDILVDGEVLASENNTGRWKTDNFVDVEYKIPAKMIEGKETFKLTFRALPGNIAGGVFNIRLLKPAE